ncbi:MAG: hypothetical protein WBM07_18280 [Chitinivibrionales bacterium]
MTACLAGAAVNDTISGTVIDSITTLAIDSVTVSSEGVSTKTNAAGAFNLVLPTTAALQAGGMNLSHGVAWDPVNSSFSWSGFSGNFSIRLQDIEGRTVSRYISKQGKQNGDFSIAGLPQGIYAASITADGRIASYKIVRLRAGAGTTFNAITPILGTGTSTLAKKMATTQSHVVTFAKIRYNTITVTVPADAAINPGIKVKMASAAIAIAFDWNGVVGTGQSLAVGQGGSPVKATTQPYHNLKLSTGNLPWQIDPTNAALTMVPLVEPIGRMATNYPSSWPTNISGETYHSCMGNEITAQVEAASGRDFVSVQGEFGENGQCMTYLQKNAPQSGVNGRAYAATLIETQAIARLAKAAGKIYGVGAIGILHGECDAGNTSYESALRQLWSDYNTDLPAITGQTQKIQMLVSQQNSTNDQSASTLAQWKAGVDYPNDIVCIGPKYQYPSVDGTHLTTDGYEPLGEKFGQVYYQRIVLGDNWRPLAPDTAARSGAVITVRFHAPVLPLVWETTFQAPHQSIAEWKNGKGFEVSVGSGRVTINSVAISGDSVLITCATTIAAGTIVGYAMFAEPARMTTPFAGLTRWGLLRDSDPFAGAITKKAQPNYCVAFQMSVP